jgi:Zn-dependent protease with chaperone function
VLGFYEWSRQAEFSADRAGLLVTQDLNTTIDSMIRMTAGQTRFDEELSRESYMEQARTYQDGVDQIGKALIWIFIGKYFTHPMPVHRAQQVERWHQSGAFDRIIAGNYERMPNEKAG